MLCSYFDTDTGSRIFDVVFYIGKKWHEQTES